MGLGDLMRLQSFLSASLGLGLLAGCQTYQYSHPLEYGEACEDIRPAPLFDADTPVECMTVFFGTNRKLLPMPGETDPNWKLIETSENADGGDLALGKADVWIPMMVQARDGSGAVGRVAGVTELLPKGQEINEIEAQYYFFITRIAAAEGDAPEIRREVFKGELSGALDDYDGKSLLLFVHGFNEEFGHMLIRTAQLSYDLTHMPNIETEDGESPSGSFQAGVPVLFTWPSQARLFGYGHDQEAAAAARPHLKDFLNILTETEGVKRINIIAHSMGNRVLIRTLEAFTADYQKANPGSDIEFQIIIAAADIEAEVFDQAASVIDSLKPNVTIYTSSSDWAMFISSIVNGKFTPEFPFWKPLFRLGDSRRGKPYIRDEDGYATIDTSGLKTNFWKIGHGYYSEQRSVLGDMACALQNVAIGERALDPRTYGGEEDGLPYYAVDLSRIPRDERCSVYRPFSPLSSDDLGGLWGLSGSGVGGGGTGTGSIPGLGSSGGLGGGNPRPPPPPSPPPITPLPPQPIITAPPPTVSLSCSEQTGVFNVYFDLDQSNLTVDETELIDDMVASIRALDGCEISAITLTGHTDALGDPAYNLRLSYRRAEAVRDALIMRGIPDDLIRIEARGETEPVRPNGEDEALINRRVEVLIELK